MDVVRQPQLSSHEKPVGLIISYYDPLESDSLADLGIPSPP